MSDEYARVQAEIDRHARLAWELAGDENKILSTYGEERWAKARWHLHMAETLRCMSPEAAVTLLREQALTALAGQAKATPGAAIPRWSR